MSRKKTEENGRPGRLTARQERVAVALASGQTVRGAAASCGVGETTVYTWSKEAVFRRRVAFLRAEMSSQAVGLLAALSGRAAAQLGKLLDAENETVRCRAAQLILELGPKLRESTLPHDGLEPAGDPLAVRDPADVVKLLAARLEQLDRAELSTAEKTRLTATLADALLRAIGVDVIDKRLEALQTVLLGRKDKGKG